MVEKIKVELNPLGASGTPVFSNGNLTVAQSSTGHVRAAYGKLFGKWYWEVRLDSGYVNISIGISNLSFVLSTGAIADTNRRGYRGGVGGSKYPNTIPYGKELAALGVVGVALDLDVGTLEFYLNGVSMGVSHTDIKSMGEVYPTVGGDASNARTITLNFGATPFKYSIPEGFFSYDGRQYGSINKILLLSSDGKVKSIEKGGYTSENAVPVMTSNVAPTGEAFSSSNSVNAYYVFDGVNTTGLQITAASGGGKFIYGYKFDSPKSIGKYSLMLNINTSQAPKAWNFEGSNDGINYEVLDTVLGETAWVAGTYREFETETVSQYTYYRINITELNGLGIFLYDFKMFESISDKLKSIPSQSEQSFINHGMSQLDLESIDMSTDFTEKHYIQDTSTVLGSGKVFEQVLDVNKVIRKLSFR